MYNSGCIDGGDLITWKSPDNMYIFEIDRVGNSYIPTLLSPQYTNIIRIKSNLGITILELKFTEFQCINILYDFSQIFYEKYYIEQNENTFVPKTIQISINPSSTTMDSQIFQITFSSSNNKLLKFSILNYNPQYQQVSEIMHIVLTTKEFVDMATSLFFQCIIDLDIDSYALKEYSDKLVFIEDFIYGKIW